MNVTLFGNRLMVDLIQRKQYWIMVGPNPVTCVLTRWWNLSHRHTVNEQSVQRQTDCRATLLWLRDTEDCWQPPGATKASILGPLVEVQPCWHSDFKFWSLEPHEKNMYRAVSQSSALVKLQEAGFSSHWWARRNARVEHTLTYNHTWDWCNM